MLCFVVDNIRIKHNGLGETEIVNPILNPMQIDKYLEENISPQEVRASAVVREIDSLEIGDVIAMISVELNQVQFAAFKKTKFNSKKSKEGYWHKIYYEDIGYPIDLKHGVKISNLIFNVSFIDELVSVKDAKGLKYKVDSPFFEKRKADTIKPYRKWWDTDWYPEKKEIR